MVVMDIRACFVTRASVAKIMALDDASILEQAHSAVYGRNRDSIINLDAATIKLFDIGMIVRFCKHARYNAALFCHAHPLGGAKSLDVFFLRDILARGVHSASLSSIGLAFRGFSYHIGCVRHVSIRVIKDRAGI